jgi:hypothetical protein
MRRARPDRRSPTSSSQRSCRFRRGVRRHGSSSGRMTTSVSPSQVKAELTSCVVECGNVSASTLVHIVSSRRSLGPRRSPCSNTRMLETRSLRLPSGHGVQLLLRLVPEADLRLQPFRSIRAAKRRFKRVESAAVGRTGQSAQANSHSREPPVSGTHPRAAGAQCGRASQVPERCSW